MVGRIFSSEEHRFRFLVHVALALGLFVGLLAGLGPHLDALRNPQAVRQLLRGFGMITPIAFVGLQLVQIVLVPIPGQVIGLAGGYLFGPLWGIVYTMTGVWLGSYAAFWLARQFGRRYITSIFTTDVVDRYDATVSGLRTEGLTILVMVPGLPDDLICFVCGTSTITKRQFLFIIILGRTPAYVLAVLSGAEFGDEQLYRGLALAWLFVVLSALGYLERERLRRAVLTHFGTEE
ncbi:MAG: TVP38/TMEM64 family protein [Halopenitus sp.]